MAKLSKKTKDNKSKVFQGNQVPLFHFPPQEELLNTSNTAQNSLQKSAIAVRAHIITVNQGKLEHFVKSPVLQ